MNDSLSVLLPSLPFRGALPSGLQSMLLWLDPAKAIIVMHSDRTDCTGDHRIQADYAAARALPLQPG